MIHPRRTNSDLEREMAEMVSGQLYRVGLTCIAAHERAEIELLVVASSNEDVRGKLPWVYDFSNFSGYRVDWTVKEPGRCLVLKTKYQRSPESEPDGNIKREDGTQPMFQRVPVASQSRRFDVIAKTTCYAKSPEHAVKKLAERLGGGSDFVKCEVEELASASGYAVARDVSHFNRASVVRG